MPEKISDDASDVPAGTSSRHRDGDDDYHEYLWGESSPRSFALKAKLGTKKREPRNVIIELDAAFDASSVVPR